MCLIDGSEVSVEDCCKSGQDEDETETKILEMQTPHTKAPDGGWGYVVILGAFINYFIADGWAYSFGVLFTELLEYFQEGHGKTAIIGALVYAVPLSISPLMCAFCNLYGCRGVGIVGGIICCLAFVGSSFSSSLAHVGLTLGIVLSIGLSMVYLSSILSVTYYFDKKRGLAIGLAVTGSGLGAFAFPPLMEMLMRKFAWRGSLFILGGIFLHVLVFSALFRPLKYKSNGEQCKNANRESSANAGNASTTDPDVVQSKLLKDTLAHKDKVKSQNGPSHNATPEDMKAKESAHKKCLGMWTRLLIEFKTIIQTMFDKSVLQNKYFIAFCASTFIAYLWIGIPYVYMVDQASLLGFSYKKAVFLLSIIGIARTFGQIILGALGDQSKINPTFLYAISIGMCGLSVGMVPLCSSYTSLCIVNLCFGFFVSCIYTLQIICVVKMLGIEKAANAFGLLQLVQGFATLLGTPLAGNWCTLILLTFLSVWLL